MKRLLLVLAALAILAAPAQARDRVLESQTKSYPAKELRNLRLNFPVGELRIEGSDSDAVQLTVRIHCKRRADWCEERADDLDFDARTRGDRLVIDIDGYSWWGDTDDYWIEAVVQAPRGLNLDIDMGVGELEINDMHADLDVSLKVGEATVRMPQDKIQRVSARVTIGEATLNGNDEHQSVSGFLGRQLRWTRGHGDARVEVNIGVGELSFRLI